jgi:tetratricopeptide (TPR) repeat protein
MTHRQSPSGRSRTAKVLRATILAAVATATAILVSASAAAAGPLRDAPEAARVAAMHVHYPQAAEQLEKGEALAAAGSLEEALQAFREGHAQDPVDAGIFWRRECETLTALGRHDEAKTACWNSLQELRVPQTIVATTRALVTGPTPPSYNEIHQALTLILVERSKSLFEQPRLAEAMCDVAESIGDGVMLQHCTEELERMAPDYPPTKHARAVLDAPCPPWRFWLGWLAIAGACIATLADAGRRFARKRALGIGGAGTAAAIVLASLALLPRTARADLPPAPPGTMMSNWAVDDHDPEAHVPSLKEMNADPLQAGYWVQDVLTKAQLATKHGDHQAAIKYYRALFKAVPDKPIALLRLCAEYEAVNDLNGAINSCGLALMMDGVTIRDYAHFVQLLLSRPGPLSPKDVAAATNVINHLKDDKDNIAKSAGYQLECELGVRIGDVDKLKECTAALATSAPGDQKTLSFEWALAMQQSQFGRARAILAQVKAAGASDESIKNMQTALDAGDRQQRKWLAVTAAGTLLFLVGVAYAVTMARRRQVPATA